MKQAQPDTVTVIPFTKLDKALGYRIPKALRECVIVGSLVRVPLLRRNVLGIVRSLKAPGDYPPAKLRFIYEVIYPFPALTSDLLQLADWIQAYYAASADTVFTTMIPAAVRKGMGLKKHSFLCLSAQFDPHTQQKLRQKAPKQAALYEFLSRQIKPLRKSVVLRRLKISPSSCNALLKKGLLQETQEQIERVAYADAWAAAEEIPYGVIELNKEQRTAADVIVKDVEAGGFHVHLLYGVTGSGKTEVYIQALKRTLALGGGVIYLVPEVVLTPQTVARLRTRLEAASGHKAVVWHSHLSEGERLDAWYALATGKARVVVGARSAIFAPIKNLRLIVVDEEHEPVYKQEEKPRYHGRDVAVYRAKLCRAVCVLGSATPALESLYNAQIGKYRISHLPHRVDDRKLPLIHVVDMKREIISQKGVVVLSRQLADKMRERWQKREQTILFINRRGYSTSMLCLDCDYLAQCDHCSIALTYHRYDESLRCHLCGYKREAPSPCPKCQSVKIRWGGHGTQRVEAVAQRLLPQARIVRMDTDAMQKKNLFRRVLSDFRLGKIDILVGTQMIAKGLDFPNVTLVGLIDADLSLRIPDFRAAERCFQLLVQVAGRAGRGDRAGEVVVQSFLPYSAPIQFARQGDFNGFSAEELAQRREYHYPPFRHLIHHLFRGKNPDKVAFYAEQWVRHLETNFQGNIEIRGPAPAPLEKIKDNYRYQLWYFVSNVSKIVPSLLALRRDFKIDKDVLDILDVDPVHLV